MRLEQRLQSLQKQGKEKDSGLNSYVAELEKELVVLREDKKEKIEEMYGLR